MIRSIATFAVLISLSARAYADGQEPTYDGKKLSDWVALLKGGDPSQRRKAAEAVAALGASSRASVPDAVAVLLGAAKSDGGKALAPVVSLRSAAVPALTAALWDDDVATRGAAAFALGRIGPGAKAAVPALVARLADDEAGVRLFAVQALQLLQARAAAPAVERLLRDPDPRVRLGASDAFALLGGKADVLVPALADFVKNGKDSERDDALALLSSLGREAAAAALPVLAGALDDREADIRRNAAVGLRQLGPAARSAIPALTAILNDEKRGAERLDAAKALWGIAQPPEVVAFLRRAAGDAGSPRRAEAARLLWRVAAAPEALAALAEIARDGKPAEQRDAVRVLRMFGRPAPDAVPALTALLKKKGDQVLPDAIDCLARAGAAASPALPALTELAKGEDAVFRLLARDALACVRRDEKSVALLAELLKDTNADIASESARRLALLGPAARGALPALRAALAHERAGVRLAAATSLRRLTRDAAALPAATALLTDTDAEIRQRAAAEIGNAFGADGAPAVPALVKLLWDEEGTVGSWAAEALGRIGPPAKAAVPALVTVLNDDNLDRVHSAAAEALGQIGPDAKAALAVLRKHLNNNDPYVRVCAALALWHIAKDDGGMATAAASLNDRAHKVRIVAAETLARGRGPEKGVPALVAELREAGLTDGPLVGNQRYMAARALGRIGPPAKAALPYLRNLIDDEDDYLAESVAQAIRAIEK